MWQRLRQDVSDDISVHVRQPVVSSRVPVGELLVIQAHEMQDRCVEVVDVNGFFDRFDSVLIGSTMNHATLDPGARKPRTERPVVMLAAWVVGRIVERSSAELGCPNDKCLVE